MSQSSPQWHIPRDLDCLLRCSKMQGSLSTDVLDLEEHMQREDETRHDVKREELGSFFVAFRSGSHHYGNL